MANKNRKLQVFISSTFTDLKEERQVAVQHILTSGHIPAGMELFIPDDESQWEIIKEWIEESDIYMLIIGGRYGSIEAKSGKSYTQLEYEYALSLNKPHFVIIIDDAWTQTKVKTANHSTDYFDNSPQLKVFREEIMKGKLVHVCSNLDKIALGVIQSLNKISQRGDLIGWIRAENTDYAAISEGFARLSRENSELKSQVEKLKSERKIHGFSILEFVKMLKNSEKEKIHVIEEFYIDNPVSYFYFAFSGFSKRLNDYRFKNLITPLRKFRLIQQDSQPSDDGALLLTYLEFNKNLVSILGKLPQNYTEDDDFEVIFS